METAGRVSEQMETEAEILFLALYILFPYVNYPYITMLVLWSIICGTKYNVTWVKAIYIWLSQVKDILLNEPYFVHVHNSFVMAIQLNNIPKPPDKSDLSIHFN